MFASVGRRLALLNVTVVVVVIAIVGLGTYLLLRESLGREADQALEDRIAAAEDAWTSLLTGETEGSAARGGDDDDEEQEEDNESREILASGDILLFLFDTRGELIANDRDIRVEGIPVLAGVEAALSGEIDTRTVTIDGEGIRVRTEPVEEHGDIVGAIQATRSERQHDEELELVGLASVVGIGLGTLIALPAGLFLARRAMRPIDAAFSRQRAFVADASHELRTPLTVLRANAEMVRRLPDPEPGEVRDEMDQMLGEIDRMTAIVNDLLALARYGDGAAGVALEPVDIAAAVEAAVRALRHQAKDATVVIEVEAPRHLTAMASRSLVEQVVRIALDNAIRYTTAGDTVTVSAAQQGETVRICVRDHGPGIDPADQPFVFDRFYRADRARSRHTGGTGLGLPIARSLVQALGGEIELESTPGEGTEVCVTLPAAP